MLIINPKALLPEILSPKTTDAVAIVSISFTIPAIVKVIIDVEAINLNSASDMRNDKDPPNPIIPRICKVDENESKKREFPRDIQPSDIRKAGRREKATKGDKNKVVAKGLLSPILSRSKRICVSVQRKPESMVAD